MSTIKKLCGRCIVLNKGRIEYSGDVNKAIAIYLKNSSFVEKASIDLKEKERYGNSSGAITMTHAEIVNKEYTGFLFGEALKMKLSWMSTREIEHLRFRIHIKTADSTTIGVFYGNDIRSCEGSNQAVLDINFGQLVPGQYSATLIAYESDSRGAESRHECVEPAFVFEITNAQNNPLFFNWNSGWGNVCFEPIKITTESEQE